MDKNIYNLRAHHGICLSFFIGEGYSSSFAENMAKVKRELEKNALICIIDHADVICNKCPKNLNGECESEKTVSNYDKSVLVNCNISKDSVMPYIDFNRLVRENIINKGKRGEICVSCEWDSLCSSLENK